MAKTPRSHRRVKTRFPRRNLGENEHDTSLWLGKKREAVERLRSTWLLEDNDILAALRHDGLTVPMVVDGAINGELFLAYVERILLPTLRKGDIVVMDNLLPCLQKFSLQIEFCVYKYYAY